jgi:hypothetical protein
MSVRSTAGIEHNSQIGSAAAMLTNQRSNLWWTGHAGGKQNDGFTRISAHSIAKASRRAYRQEFVIELHFQTLIGADRIGQKLSLAIRTDNHLSYPLVRQASQQAVEDGPAQHRPQGRGQTRRQRTPPKVASPHKYDSFGIQHFDSSSHTNIK